MYNEAIAFLAKLIVAGGGLGFVAYKALERFGGRWLSNEFDKRLKALEHEQNKEIEKLRSELTRSFDRRSKLHQREFEVLPDVWAKTCDAYWNTKALVHPMQTHPDLNRMGAAQLESFISSCELLEWQKDELRQEQDKTRYYIDKLAWHRISACRAQITLASNSLGKLGIFINKTTRDKIDGLNDLLWRAITEHELNQGVRPVPLVRDDINKLLKEGESMREELEAEIRRILWDGNEGAP